ncbi:MAG: DMT family transporter [Rhodobacteraceae bacterium]|nr:DMT family transporter [Paracoccaceae bacterium]
MRLMLLTLLTMTAFAANSVLNRMAVGPGLIDPIAFATVRVAAGAAVLAALMLARGGWRLGGPGRGIGVAGLTVYLLGFSLAYLALDAGTGALVLFGVVQVTMFAGALAQREAVPARRWAGAGLALAGLVLLLAPGIGAAPPAAPTAAMAAAGIGWGLYSLAGRGATDPLGATAANFLLAVPVVAGLALLSGAGLAEATWAGLGLAALSGAVTSGLGYALWYAILPALGAARGAVAQLTVPVIAAGGGALVLAEPVGLRFALAAALVLGGVGWASWPRR